MQTLFDENGLLNIADVIANHPSFKAIMEDGIVSNQEIKEQAETTIAALRKVQEICSDEQQAAVLNAISEMGVLFVVYHNYQLQDFRI